MANPLYYLILLTVWSANINDLIRGDWFYTNLTQIIVANIMGIFALILIIMEEKAKE